MAKTRDKRRQEPGQRQLRVGEELRHGLARILAQGELRETLAQPGKNRVRNRCALTGSVTTFGSRHLHDVSNAATAPAVSVHAYSPPLTAMRRYEMTASGLALAGTDRAELDW